MIFEVRFGTFECEKGVLFFNHTDASRFYETIEVDGVNITCKCIVIDGVNVCVSHTYKKRR